MNPDRDILRRLAGRIAAIADDPVNHERRAAWLALDSGRQDRPMILAEHLGIRDQHRPFDPVLECQQEWARTLERKLRETIWRFEVLGDDHVVEAAIDLPWRVTTSNYGVNVETHHGSTAERMGSYAWEPPIRDLDGDFALLKPRTFAVDRAQSWAERTRVEETLGDLLPVRWRFMPYWTMGLTWPAISLIGLEGLMMAMYDQPQGLHRLMAFLRDDHLAFTDWLEAEGLLTLNNGNDSIGSGSEGHTLDLPVAGFQPERVRNRDRWVLVESQETVGVGPDQFEEFIFPYQKTMAEHFGKCYYGCCEPVHTRFRIIKGIANLARVSVSPWCDQEAMAAAVGRELVFSRKPNPTLISTEIFDEAAIRADLRQTLDVARGCRLEIIMKDVHTLSEDPGRVARWVAIARDEVARARG